jgi:hypothetical protein
MLLLIRGHFRALPAFTLYVGCNLLQAVLLLLIYRDVCFIASAAVFISWTSQAVVLVVKGLVVVELCNRILRPYRGIWALAWLLLLGAALLVLLIAAVEAVFSFPLAALIAHRGLELAIAVALVGLLVLVRHYSIPAQPALKTLATGFCLYSCLVVIVNLVVEQGLVRLEPRLAGLETTWNEVLLVAFILTLVYWGVALRHPLPAGEAKPALLSDSEYREFSFEIHSRLRVLNDRLAEMLRG